MALFAGKLETQITDLEAAVELLDQQNNDLHTRMAERAATVKELEQAIRTLEDRLKREISANNLQVAGLNEEIAERVGMAKANAEDAAKWRSIRPQGKWLRTTTVTDETNQTLHVFQPAGGQFSEGQPYVARILSAKRDLFGEADG